jgi:hypothetical protein
MCLSCNQQPTCVETALARRRKGVLYRPLLQLQGPSIISVSPDILAILFLAVVSFLARFAKLVPTSCFHLLSFLSLNLLLTLGILGKREHGIQSIHVVLNQLVDLFNLIRWLYYILIRATKNHY